jgi:hypothetical protein
VDPPEEWVEAVVVVVDLDAGLPGKGSGDPADVLDDPAPTGDREGQEQGVQFGEVEAFAEVGAGGQQQDWDVTLSESFEDRLMQLLAGPAFQYGRLELVTRAQFASEGFKVLGTVGEYEHVSASSVRVSDVDADAAGSFVISFYPSEVCLDSDIFWRVRAGQGFVHDEVPTNKDCRRRARQAHGGPTPRRLHPGPRLAGR